MKRLLLFSLLFSMLILSLFYYVFPDLIFPPRRDVVPSGAYTVPWGRPYPSLEELESRPQLPDGPLPFKIASVMHDALKLNMTFRIEIPSGTRVIPSTVYLAHDADLLYVGGEFAGMYENPASDPKDMMMPNFFHILFDTANDGELRFPESGSRFPAILDNKRPIGWGYHDMVWEDITSQFEHGAFVPSDYYYDWVLKKACPAISMRNEVVEYDNSTGTLTMIFSRALRVPAIAEINTLQMRTGERWVTGFLLELGYSTNLESFGDYVDGWPTKAYPYLSRDSSWWPKLAIDLANPPASFTDQQDTSTLAS